MPWHVVHKPRRLCSVVEGRCLRHPEREHPMPQERPELALTAPLSRAHGASTIIRHDVGRQSRQKNRDAQRQGCLECSCSAWWWWFRRHLDVIRVRPGITALATKYGGMSLWT